MTTNPAIAILYHIFYEDSLELVCDELQAVQAYQPAILFNVCMETPGKKTISNALKKAFPGCYVIFTSNMGKDIGAKLALLQLLLELDFHPDYLLFLHDKKSLQALKSATWKNDLLKIISADNLNTVLQLFVKDIQCGMIATKEYIITEPVDDNGFTGVNGKLLNRLLETYQLQPPSYDFIAGTMFWARALPMLQFFRKHPPLDVRRQLEAGNVIDNFGGTITHSWERLLSWIITNEKFDIKGI